MAAKPCVFIHTNERQWIGALVSRYSFERNSRHADRFDIRFLKTSDHAFLRERDGELFLRDGIKVKWQYENLQSFTPLRFMPPEAMGYEGRAIVVDPDVFAVKDVWELLSRDMGGKAIMCRPRKGRQKPDGDLATSVMLLDCAKLTHWKAAEQFSELFEFKRDYMDWITLKLESRQTIGLFENEWNDFDRLTPQTRMIHNTKRQTQPWKTGLPVDFTPARKVAKLEKPNTWLLPLKRRVLGKHRKPTVYTPHPDPSQERFFFGLLKECIEKRIVTEDLLQEEMDRDHIRHDALEVLDRTQSLVTQTAE